ncbi:MAG: hypothetical protein H6811_02875 [Phycisphaeraceae bacterium]|nr:hypothetical protein [Phycisphaeraceae bacterium]
MPRAEILKQIDDLVARAKGEDPAAQPFEVERLAARALQLAHSLPDYLRMARAGEVLRTARAAWRATALESGTVTLVRVRMARTELTQPGCYLVQPPMIGADARSLRDMLHSRAIAAIVVAREPMTSKGLWPVVAVGQSSTLRAQVDPPPGVRPQAGSPTGDVADGLPGVEWFEGALGAIGRAAIARLRPTDPAAWQVEDLVDALEVHPDDLGLHDALIDACVRAEATPPPDGQRRRPIVEDPFCF